MPPASPRVSLLSATSLVTAVASVATPASAAFFTFSENTVLANFTAGTLGGTYDIGHNSGVSASTGFTLLGVSGPNPGVRARNTTTGTLTISVANASSLMSITNQNTTLGSLSTDTFNIAINTSGRSRGAASDTFTYTGTKTGGTTETNTLTVRTNFVAPVASQTANATIYALPGKTATQALVIQNTGDGNRAGADNVSTGGAFASNLRGSSKVTNGTGWTGSVVATNLTDTTGGQPAANASTTSNFTYTGGASRTVSATASIVTSFTNGSTDNKGAAQTITTTLTGVTVAPVQSITTGGPTVYALPGEVASRDFTIKNVGDGSRAGATLDGTLSNTLGTGFASTTATGSYALADGVVGGPATTRTHTVTYTGQSTRGASSNATVTATSTNGSSDGKNTAQTISQTFKALTVAPVASVASTVTFGNVRVGASGTATLAVANIGDGNLAGTGSTYNLRGSVGSASGAFSGAGGALNGASGLNDSNGGGTTSASYSFTYTPTARGAHSTGVTTTLNNGVGNTNANGTANTTLSGTGVGPVYAAQVDSKAVGNGATVNFLWGGAPVQFEDLLVSNVTSDTPAGTATDLSLTVEIINDPLNEFQLSLNGSGYGHTASFVSSAGGLPATIASISLQFNSKVSGGDGLAQLRISTDEGASFGGAGAIYIYNLAAVPEPGTMMVVGAGLLGLAALRRRPRAAAPGASARGESGGAPLQQDAPATPG